jgi:hypothetical protein
MKKKYSPPREVTSISANWCVDPIKGETSDVYRVGENGVSAIDYFNDKFGRHFSDVHFSNGEKKRVFVLNSVSFSKKREQPTFKTEYKGRPSV